jgi:hypothetical protein
MKNLNFSLLALLAFMLTAFSCDKEDDLEVMEATATLIWSGDYAVDGCGFSIQLNDKHYKPDNEQDIDAKFKTESHQTVRIKYSLPAKDLEYSCGWRKHKSNSIRLLSIKEA